MKYTIKVIERSEGYVEVEAKNRDEAMEIAEDMYYAGEVNFDNSEEDFKIIEIAGININEDEDEDEDENMNIDANENKIIDNKSNKNINDEYFDIDDNIEVKYDFIMFDELAYAISEAPENTKFDFTFDQPKDWLNEKEIYPTGWNSVKKINLFDEAEGVIAVGYYGGGSTKTYDIAETMDDYYDKDPLTAIKRIIKDYMEIEHNTGDYVCVEITKENGKYIKEAINEMKL